METNSPDARKDRLPGTSSTPQWWRYLSYTLLILAILVTALFLFSSWAVNAESLGKRNMDIALTSVYGTMIALYSALALAPITLLAGVIATFVRYRSDPIWVAFGIALIPLAWFILS